MTGLEYLEKLGHELEAVRRLRYEDDSLFDDVSAELLDAGVRGLKAIAYSAETGARKLAGILERRRGKPVTSPGEQA